MRKLNMFNVIKNNITRKGNPIMLSSGHKKTGSKAWGNRDVSIVNTLNRGVGQYEKA